jgi:hypothetical protein
MGAGVKRRTDREGNLLGAPASRRQVRAGGDAGAPRDLKTYTFASSGCFAFSDFPAAAPSPWVRPDSPGL